MDDNNDDLRRVWVIHSGKFDTLCASLVSQRALKTNQKRRYIGTVAASPASVADSKFFKCAKMAQNEENYDENNETGSRKRKGHFGEYSDDELEEERHKLKCKNTVKCDKKLRRSLLNI